MTVVLDTRTNAGIRLEPNFSIPLWRELLWPWERFTSLFSLTTWGFGVPRGDGSAVVLVPGFMGTDFYLTPMYWWLWAIGYTPVMSGIGLNAKCLKSLCDQLTETVREAFKKSGRRVTLIGHSLGGTIALLVALANPDMVEQVILLASPIRPRNGAIQVNPITVGIAKVVRTLRSGKGLYPDCLTPSCHCLALITPEVLSRSPVTTTFVYTEEDGIVNWRNTRPDGQSNVVRVKGRHLVLPFNPQVCRTIAEILHGNKIAERAVA